MTDSSDTRKYNIVIATGTYPPEIGGSSDYSAGLFGAVVKQGQKVSVLTYGPLKKFPTGIRHFLYFCKLCIKAINTDYIIALDIFSVALPSVIFARLFGKKIVIRVGGDFLWELYAERTHEPIFLSEFYSIPRDYNLKESIIFRLIHFIFNKADMIVFSTEWQRNIMKRPYRLDLNRTAIIENFYQGKPLSVKTFQSESPKEKIFFSPSRDIFIKNKQNLRKAFNMVATDHPDVVLDEKVVSHQTMIEKIQKAYAIIVVSISEVSPNLVLHAIEYGLPIIITKDTGIADRLKELAVFVDPLSIESIKSGMESLLNPNVYGAYKQKINQNTHTHSWDEIATEFLELYKQI